MDQKLLDAFVQVLSNNNGCPTDCSIPTAFQQTLIRFNEQAAQVSANFLQNAQNQQSANHQMLIKLTADITGTSAKPA